METDPNTALVLGVDAMELSPHGFTRSSLISAMAGDLTGAMDDVGVAYTFPDFDGGLAADVLVLHLLAMAPEIIEDPEGDGCDLPTTVDTGSTPDGGGATPGGTPPG